MKKRRISFKLIYLIYVLILAALVAAAVLYVRSLLFDYEASQPEHHAQAAMEQLCTDAATGDFWVKYNLPEINAGPFEQGRNIKAEYLALFAEDALSVTQTGSTEDELFYTVARDGFPLAEIKLHAAGPAVTKLAVLSLREWAVASVTPILEPHTYSLTLPNSFVVTVNDVTLTGEHGSSIGERQTEYTLSDLYLLPAFAISDRGGNTADYTLKNNRVMVEFFDYSLTLPSALEVEVNGQPAAGESTGDDLVLYDIVTLSKPSVCIRDDYGNTVNYEGGNELPLTYVSVTADSRLSVQVAGNPVPDHCISTRENPEYAQFADFVPDLPKICDYTIAVLQDDATITVTDEHGNPIALDSGTIRHDLTGHVNRLDFVPDEVATQVDVLRIAQNWSMFMTDDLPFEQLKGDLVAGSYQYNVALKYATGVDIKYTSKHTLFDPAFTENSVTNFTWITDRCFSVDISFVKHMRLYYGARVDDPMNDRFFFVYWDDTDNGVNDPAWKLAGMKEIV